MARPEAAVTLVFNRIPQLAAAMRAAVDAAVAETARDIEARAGEGMAETKHGRTYRRGDAAHRASAPGEAPAIESGDLVGSIRAGEVGPGRWVVASDDEKAPTLELGGGRIAPRPFLKPAAEAARPGFEAAVKRALGAGHAP